MPVQVIAIDETNFRLVQRVERLRVVAGGPVGPRGPKGDKGDTGDPGADGSGDLSYVHDQPSPATTWTVTHNLSKRPSVTVIDTSGQAWIGKVEYLSDNAVRLSFNAAFAGKAYLN